MKTIISISIAILFSMPVYANKPVDKLAEPILKAIDSNDIDELAYIAFPEGSETREYFSDANLNELNQTLEVTLSETGKSYGHKLIYESNLEDTYILRYYLLKMKRQPMLLKLEFYKPNNKWKVQGMSLDDDLDDYIEKHAKNLFGYLSKNEMN